MHTRCYVFAQITIYWPQRQFRRIAAKYPDRTQGWGFSHWNHLLVLMFGQLIACRSIRQLTDITTAHAKRSFYLGFGAPGVVRITLSKANMLREPRIVEQFAFYRVSLAKKRCISKEFELNGTFYPVDYSTIDIGISVFRWAFFRSTNSRFKLLSHIDIATEIPVFYRITNANVHDTKFMDSIGYESNAVYIFDRGYFDLARLFAIHLCGAFFVIREKRHPKFEIVDGDEAVNGEDNVLLDQAIRFTGNRNRGNYPAEIRRIVYYAPDLKQSFVYYTNNFYLAGKDIACFTAIAAKWNFSSNGSSSISKSNLSGVTLRMLSEYRFM